MNNDNTSSIMNNTKYKVWSLWTIRILRRSDLPFNRDTGLPAKPERYHSVWNDIKLAWLVLTRKADAFIWEDNDLPPNESTSQ